MKAYEIPIKVTAEGKIELPDALLSLLPCEQVVRVIILVPESTDAEEQAVWSRLTAEQFFAGYSEADSIYDRIFEETKVEASGQEIELSAINDVSEDFLSEEELNYYLNLFDRITFDPRIMAGQACIRGMRIPVSLIINLVAHGKQVAEILEEYPDLQPEDIQQALEYASWLAREHVYPQRLEAVG